jgi:hypothetical protein
MMVEAEGETPSSSSPAGHSPTEEVVAAGLEAASRSSPTVPRPGGAPKVAAKATVEYPVFLTTRTTSSPP